jgi:quercetin dioxygenase-like cupin family protein
MHHVSSLNWEAAVTPEVYIGHSTHFRRATYVDHTCGSVHMGTGICELMPGGSVHAHIHAFEETFIVLEGEVILLLSDAAYRLRAGHFGLIPTGTRHGWRSVGDQPARWLENQSPQPRPRDYGRDTFFAAGDIPEDAPAPDSSATGLGFFDETQLPRPGEPAQMEGFNPTTGVAIRMFVDRSFGAVHQSLFLIQYMPGARIAPHDHTFEESYYILSGEVEATCDGKVYTLTAGSVVWTSVGCIHSFENKGAVPVRWLETQTPLPPSKEIFRFEHDWASLAAQG